MDMMDIKQRKKTYHILLFEEIRYIHCHNCENTIICEAWNVTICLVAPAPNAWQGVRIQTSLWPCRPLGTGRGGGGAKRRIIFPFLAIFSTTTDKLHNISLTIPTLPRI